MAESGIKQNSSISRPFSWVCTMLHNFQSNDSSVEMLATLEDRILSCCSCAMEKRKVYISNEKFIWTISINSQSKNTPLVLIHGISGGLALWVSNLKSLSEIRPVYAIDLLGFGRSTRSPFSDDPLVAEMEFVESIEAWRAAVGLERFIILGHDFGGYLATLYAMRFPARTRHLILVNPWGFQEYKTSPTRHLPDPTWIKSFGLFLQSFNPHALLRIAGSSWGPKLIHRFMPDYTKHYSHCVTGDTIAQYLYYCNSLPPTGETAFKHMTFEFGWPRYPIQKRMQDIPSEVQMTFIFGRRSWVNSDISKVIKNLRPNSYVDSQIIIKAGHFVFAEMADLFNQVIKSTCTLISHDFDVPASKRSRSKSESTPNLKALNYPMGSRRFARRQSQLPRTSECLGEVDENDYETDFMLYAEIPKRKATFTFGDDDDDND